MKSVCQIVQNVYDVDSRVRRKVDALVAAGYSVDVFALRAPQGEKTYTLDGATIHTIALGKMRGSLFRYAYEYVVFFLWAFLKVSLLMRRRRYAVIDVNTLPDFLIFAGIVARWMGAKLVLDMHEITAEFYMSKYEIPPDSWKVRLLNFQERISFNFADYVITINEPIQELLVSRGMDAKKSIVLMNAADEARFAPRRGLQKSAPQSDVQPNSFVMMYHGTLTRIYGLEIAVESFSKVHTQMPSAELCILGGGPERKILADLAQEHGIGEKVKLIGQVPSSEIPGWLSKCDVGILPIRRDVFLDFAFPNKLPEFIISGKAVLMSRLKAIRHYFSEDALAYFEPNNADDLAKQMVRLYQNKALCAKMAAQAKKEYEPIRWDVMKQRYLVLINQIAGIQSDGSQTPQASAMVGA
ncbi:MAG TPA: glycosyltransferase family 4 protein [Terriglobales bacterium]|nr:glycosyltransferase family 4 protein [Terriglobales bacterium]